MMFALGPRKLYCFSDSTLLNALLRLADMDTGAVLGFEITGAGKNWSDEQADLLEIELSRSMPGLVFRREWRTNPYSVKVIVQRGEATGQ